LRGISAARGIRGKLWALNMCRSITNIGYSKAALELLNNAIGFVGYFVIYSLSE